MNVINRFDREKPDEKLTVEERNVAEAFEGRKSYKEHLGQPMFEHKPSRLQLGV